MGGDGNVVLWWELHSHETKPVSPMNSGTKKKESVISVQSVVEERKHATTSSILKPGCGASVGWHPRMGTFLTTDYADTTDGRGRERRVVL
jgi:hypothetical protein